MKDSVQNVDRNNITFKWAILNQVMFYFIHDSYLITLNTDSFYCCFDIFDILRV